MTRAIETFDYELLHRMALDYPNRHAFIYQSARRTDTHPAGVGVVIRYAREDKEDPEDHRQWVACFKVRPRFTRFLDFQRDRKQMEVDEFARIFEGADYNFINTASLLVYAEGLFIECLKDGGYSLFIENEDWTTYNLLELELRLFAWHISFYPELDHPFNNTDSGTNDLNWYIGLSQFEHAARRLYTAWVDDKLSDNVDSLTAADYPWDGSFDDHYYRIQKWFKTQLTLI